MNNLKLVCRAHQLVNEGTRLIRTHIRAHTRTLVISNLKLFASEPVANCSPVVRFRCRLQVHVLRQAGDGLVGAQLLLPLRQHRGGALLPDAGRPRGEDLQRGARVGAQRAAAQPHAVLPLSDLCTGLAVLTVSSSNATVAE